MEKMEIPKFSVSDFLAIVNQSLETAFGVIDIEGEVSSFKVNHQKYVFFDLKDDDGLVGCFMMAWQLRLPIEDGMRVVVRAVPKVTQWGKFSLTVQAIRPVGEGSLKKSFDLLKEKLTKEGVFDEARKRTLPERPIRAAVISSTQAAGYADFVKIANERLGGTHFDVYHTRVQGEGAADEIILALEKCNQVAEPYEVVVIIRGGGSQEDLATFNDEKLVRSIAGSRSPVLTGIGHETDETLVDFVADIRASTPSNAAQILLPDRQTVLAEVKSRYASIDRVVHQAITTKRMVARQGFERCQTALRQRIDAIKRQLADRRQLLQSFNPESVLERGYALVRGKVEVGQDIEITTRVHIIQAEVKQYDKRSRTIIG